MSTHAHRERLICNACLSLREASGVPVNEFASRLTK